MVPSVRLQARHLLTLRAAETVMRKFLNDSETYWIHAEISSSIGALDGFVVKGLVWSPQKQDYMRATIGFTAFLFRGRWALTSAHVFDDPVTTDEFYYFTYTDIKELIELHRFSEGQDPQKILPGFITHAATKTVEVE